MTANIVDLETTKAQQRSKRRVCPTCGAPSEAKNEPFCSVRCCQLDLGHWLNEDYRVPIVDIDDMSEIPLEEGE